MNEKYPRISIQNFTVLVEKKFVHFGIERSIQQYEDYLKFIEDIELFFLRNFKNSDFELAKPPQLVNSVKWKYYYIVFRKRTSNQS